MTIQLLACPEVASRLGAPTLEGLRSRLTPAAPCLQCGAPLGEGPATVIGQQYGSRALVTGAHQACRPSEWIHRGETDRVEVPLSDDLTVAVELILDLPAPRGLGWLARLVTARMPMPMPTLIVLPFVGWAWVELIAPAETVNDDLSFYRDHLGLASDGPPTTALPGAQAWITAGGNLVASVKGYQFTSHAPVDDGLAAAVRKRGVIQLVIASGVPVGADGAIDFSDVEKAGTEGRIATALIEAGAPPGEPAPPRAAARDRLGKPAADEWLVDGRTRAKLGPDGLREVTASLWPHDCQTCGGPLGNTAPALFAQDAGAFVIARLHHPRCQPPGWNDQGLIIAPTSSPTVTSTSRALLIPRYPQCGRYAGQPLLLVNPSLEMVFLEHGPDGTWQATIQDEYPAAGLVPPSHQPPPGPQTPAGQASARLQGSEVTITLHGGPVTLAGMSEPITLPGTEGPTLGSTLAGPGGTKIAQRIRDLGGLYLGVTHMLQPEEFTPASLAQVLHADRIILGWIPLASS